METKSSEFIGFFILNVNAGGKTVRMSGRGINQQRQLWVLGISVSFPHRTGTALELKQRWSFNYSAKRRDCEKQTVKAVKTATVKNTCKLLPHKTVTFNNDNEGSAPRSPHSFRNRDNGSETSDRTSQPGQHLAQKKQPFLFWGYKCKQFLIWRPMGGRNSSTGMHKLQRNSL